MEKREPVTLWCVCGTGYASRGELPPICPDCNTDDPQWSTAPPFRPTFQDKKFLKSLKIEPS